MHAAYSRLNESTVYLDRTGTYYGACLSAIDEVGLHSRLRTDLLDGSFQH
jgi:hypothetical protein